MGLIKLLIESKRNELDQIDEETYWDVPKFLNIEHIAQLDMIIILWWSNWFKVKFDHFYETDYLRAGIKVDSTQPGNTWVNEVQALLSFGRNEENFTSTLFV